MSGGSDLRFRSWSAVLAVYGGAFVIGATLDSFPASSAYLVALRGFSAKQYGAIYIPQLIAAILGAVGGGMASRVFPLRRLFQIAVSFFLMAQGLLILCGWPDSPLDIRAALFLAMAATAAFGFGFGLGGGPLNGLVTLLFPRLPIAGLSCSAFFPMLVGFSAEDHPHQCPGSPQCSLRRS